MAESEGVIVGYSRARLLEPASDAPPDTVPDWIGERAAEAWYFANARSEASIALHRRFGFEEVSRRFSFPGLTFEGGEGILFRILL